VTYVAPAVRFGRHTRLVFHGRYPEIPYYWRRDALGEHARWMLKMHMKYDRWPTWRELLRPGRLEFPTTLTIVDIPWWAEWAGWLIGLWACWEALR
jgi:hypothetical protein